MTYLYEKNVVKMCVAKWGVLERKLGELGSSPLFSKNRRGHSGFAGGTELPLGTALLQPTSPYRLHLYPNVSKLVRVFAIANPSVCRLSVCNVATPYSGVLTFRQYFFTAVYLGHRLSNGNIADKLELGDP